MNRPQRQYMTKAQSGKYVPMKLSKYVTGKERKGERDYEDDKIKVGEMKGVHDRKVDFFSFY